MFDFSQKTYELLNTSFEKLDSRDIFEKIYEENTSIP
jgi:arsenate reductase-like glutaredoxin family protein